jgi:hypothetical protein
MRTSSKRVLQWAVGVLACVALEACGGAALGEAATPEQDSLASELEQKAADLDTELARLEGARDEAGQVQAQKPSTPDAEPPAGAEPGAGEAGVTRAAPAAEEVQTDSEPEPPPPPSKRERCRTACKALDSMQRSSQRICSLMGDNHEKCTWARSQVDDARGRVERAGCSCQK